MPTLVERLQQDSLDTKVPVTDLLMRCILAATKLSQNEFADWARCELDGYGKKKLPNYRLVTGTPQAFNPFRGFQDIMFVNPKEKLRVSTMHFNQPISEIEQTLQASDGTPGGVFKVNYHPTTEKKLMDAMNTELKPVLSVSPGQITKIMNAVRKIVLEWSLKLEANGIQGQEVGFSEEEKQRASVITYNVKTLIQGSISNSQLQISSPKGSQLSSFEQVDLAALTHIIDGIQGSIDRLQIDVNRKEVLSSEVVKLKDESLAQEPRTHVIREGLSTIRNVLEGAASDILAAGFLYQIQKLIGS